jgi:hypothetical protein
MAPRWPVSASPTKSQFFFPIAVGRMAFSTRLLCTPCKASLESGCKSRRATSLQPEALGAVQEETNELKYYQKRPVQKQVSKPCGLQREVNTEQASKCRRGSRPATITGKAAAFGGRAKRLRTFHRGSGGSTHGVSDDATREVWGDVKPGGSR